MEDNIQTIVAIIIAVFILFIFPVYMAYEKKDDIAYALAMRYTQDLVDEVRSKGYITKNMYDDYSKKLKITGNSYDIQMTHEYNRYDPITNYYKIEGNKYILVKSTTQEERKEYEDGLIEKGIYLGKLSEDSSKKEKEEYIANQYKLLPEPIDKVQDTYMLSQEVYNENHILNVLNSERKLQLNSTTDTVVCSDVAETQDGCQFAYIMNVDDNFNITIKNTNITLATIMYNMVTANTLDSNTRIYVNYGGAILSSKWYENVDYAMMKHDNLSLNQLEEIIIFEEERNFYTSAHGGNYPTQSVSKTINDIYIIDFDVKPTGTTELREKGELKVADYAEYNFALGNRISFNENSMLSVSIGINGISLIVNKTPRHSASTINILNLPTYENPVERTRIVQEEYTYIDEETGEEKTGLRNKEETYIEYITEQRRITDYSKINAKYISQGSVEVKLTGKSGVPDYSGIITLNDEQNILSGLNRSINNPDMGSIGGTLGVATNKRGTRVNYSINITDTTIGITANKYVSKETTILSYPVKINDYVNVRIEFEETAEGKYIAYLNLDGQRVEESIELDILPKFNIVGKTYIGSEERFFEGYLRNVKMFS